MIKEQNALLICRLVVILILVLVKPAHSMPEKYQAPSVLNARIDSAIKAGKLAFAESHIPEALLAFELADQIAREESDMYALAEVNNWLGNVYQDSEKFNKAEKHYNEATRLANLFTDEYLLNRIRNNHASLLRKTGQPKQALRLYDSLLVFFNDDTYSKAAILNNIGGCYRELKDFASARDKYFASLLLAQEINDTHRLAEIQTNLGSIFYNLEDHDQAIHHYRMALNHYLSLEYSDQCETIYLSMFGIYKRDGNKTAAKELMAEYLTVFKDVPENNFAHLAYFLEPSSSSTIIWQLATLLVFMLLVAAMIMLYKQRVNLYQQNNILINQQPNYERLRLLAGARKGRLPSVYLYLAEGKAQKEIAYLMGDLSTSTISDDVKRIQHILNVTDVRADAIENGFKKHPSAAELDRIQKSWIESGI